MDVLRDPTKHFIEDDDFFRSQRDEGQLWKFYAAGRLSTLGVAPMVLIDDGFRRSQNEIAKYAGRSGGLIVRGHNFAVKSRDVAFTSPDDWPKNWWPMIVDTKRSFEGKWVKPTGYIFISRRTQRLMGVLCCEASRWVVQKRTDGDRGLDEFYHAPRELVLDEAQLVATMKALPLDGEGMEFATLREDVAELRLLVPKLCSAVTELQEEVARLRVAFPEGDAK